MSAIRRWYILLVCVVSLQATTWASIALFRGLLLPDGRDPIAAVAFQIAVIVIGLPIFLGHWIWAQRLAANDPEERGSAVRRFYLYGTLALLLAPIIANSVSLIDAVFAVLAGVADVNWLGESPIERIVRNLVAIVVLALLWWYHRQITAADAKAVPEIELSASLRRLYLFGFSTVGLIMVSAAVTSLLHWMLLQFNASLLAISTQGLLSLRSDVSTLAVGLPLWLVFWTQAQRLFYGPDQNEHESVLRKVYLYALVFVTVLTAVTNATFILSGLLQQLLGLSPDGDLRGPLTLIFVSGVLWAYHARVLRDDSVRIPEAPRQATVRRVYLYLVAAIGLAAALIGGGGVLSVLIRAVAEGGFTDFLSTQLAWFTAAMLAGTPVWLLPWRRISAAAGAPAPAGAAERRSLARKLYLYFYLFVATMVVLSGAIYVIARLLRLILGDPFEGNLLSDLGQALAFTTLGVITWLYHGSELRDDGRAERRDQVGRLAGMRVAVLDSGDGRFGQAIVEGLRQNLPGIEFDLIVPGASVDALVAAPAQIAAARLIVGPWTIAASGSSGLHPDLARLVVSSPARKLLVPTQEVGWEWVGVERATTEALVAQTVHAVRQIGEGDQISPTHSLNAASIIGIIVGLVLLLPIIVWLFVVIFL